MERTKWKQHLFSFQFVLFVDLSKWKEQTKAIVLLLLLCTLYILQSGKNKVEQHLFPVHFVRCRCYFLSHSGGGAPACATNSHLYLLIKLHCSRLWSTSSWLFTFVKANCKDMSVLSAHHLLAGVRDLTSCVC